MTRGQYFIQAGTLQVGVVWRKTDLWVCGTWGPEFQFTWFLFTIPFLHQTRSRFGEASLSLVWMVLTKTHVFHFLSHFFHAKSRD